MKKWCILIVVFLFATTVVAQSLPPPGNPSMLDEQATAEQNALSGGDDAVTTPQQSTSGSSGSSVTGGSSSGAGGGSGGGSGRWRTTVNESRERPCTEQWTCSEWSECRGTTQTRECTDARKCPTAKLKPIDQQECLTESLRVSSPTNEQRTRPTPSSPIQIDARQPKSSLPWGTIGIAVLGILVVAGILYMLTRKKNKPSPYRNFVVNARTRGHSDDKITGVLIKQGLSDQQIVELLKP